MRALLASCELDAGAVKDPACLRRILTGLVAPPARVAIVLNARDDGLDGDRRAALDRERVSLGPALGDRAGELDLRDYAGRPRAHLAGVLDGLDLLWVTGGSAHALRAAVAQTAFADLIGERVARGALAYGGVSAGAVIAGPALFGAQLSRRPPHPGQPPVWGGLGLVSFSLVPHHPPPGASPTDLTRVATHIRDAGHHCLALVDGEAVVIDGSGERRIDARATGAAAGTGAERSRRQ